MFEQYTISDMIKALGTQKEEHGNLEVILASDPMGDKVSYVGNLVQRHKGQDTIVEQTPFKVHGGKIIIFPIKPIPISDMFKDIKRQ
jgi:hypothetical protein